jgi:hypothetical protein
LRDPLGGGEKPTIVADPHDAQQRNLPQRHMEIIIKIKL